MKIKNVLLAFLVIISLSACDDKKEVAKLNEKPTLKIGIIMSFTGADPEGANNAKNALLFVKEKKLSSSPINYELIFEDSKGEPARGITVAKKLIDYDKVDVIFSNISAVSKAISPHIEREKVIHIAFSSDKETAKSKNSFVFWISAEEYADKMYKLLQKLNAKNVVALVNSDITSSQRYEALNTLIKETDIKMYKEDIISGTTDFRITINKILDKKPDLLLLLAPLPELDIIAKQVRETDSNIMITSMDFINYSSHKDLFEGSIYISTNDGDKKAVKEIMDAINTKNPFALAYMNDALMLVDKAVKEFYQGHKTIPTGEKLAEEILKIRSFQGAVGDIVIKEDGVINPQAVVKEIKDGYPIIVKD